MRENLVDPQHKSCPRLSAHISDMGPSAAAPLCILPHTQTLSPCLILKSTLRANCPQVTTSCHHASMLLQGSPKSSSPCSVPRRKHTCRSAGLHQYPSLRAKPRATPIWLRGVSGTCWHTLDKVICHGSHKAVLAETLSPLCEYRSRCVRSLRFSTASPTSGKLVSLLCQPR